MAEVNRRPITICGGGIAGLSLGVALARRKFEVTLCEAGHYPRHRVCGEFISGVSPDTLESLGIATLLEDATQNSITAWFDRDGQVLRKQLPRPALGISRFRLDQRLAEEFTKLGGILQEGTRLRKDELLREGTVHAMGRPKVSESDWLGLKCHLFGFPLEADLEMHLGDGGYLGMSRIEEKRVNACGLFPLQSELSLKKDTALPAYLHSIGLDSLAERIDKSPVDEASQLGVSAFILGEQACGNGGAFRIGDQNAIIGPFTGNGMSMALESATLAIPHLASYASGEISWERASDRYSRAATQKFQRRIKTSNLLHPFLTKPRLQGFMTTMARTSLLPFGPLYSLTR